MSGPDRLIVLVAGDTVYVFADQNAADAQHIVLIGSNLDVVVFRPTVYEWDALVAAPPSRDLFAGVEIVDARHVVVPPGSPFYRQRDQP